MIRLLVFLPAVLLSESIVSAQSLETSQESPAPPPGIFSNDISLSTLPDNWYAWNLLRKDETGLNPSKISTPTNWTHNSSTPDANKTIFGAASASLAFFKPATNADGSKNYNNYMYSALKLDFTPLTLGGLYVESGALGTTSNLSDPSKVRESTFSIEGSKTGGTYYLNILSSKDSGDLQNPNGTTNHQSTAVDFNLHEDFTLGSSNISFTGINIYSDWNLAIDAGKALKIYGNLRGGEGTTITLSNGGQLSLYKANYLLRSDWYLKNNSTLKFEAEVGKEDSTITSTNLLGSGKLTVENGILEIAGSGATINNHIEILEGGRLTVREKVRNFGTSVTIEEFQKTVYYINVTGNISGKGTFSRKSDAGKNSTNESWIFTGDNSNFSGNWETNADVDYYVPDKVYDYLPIAFGNGAAFSYGDNFYAIAGTGAIIGLVGQDSRAGAVVGFNYGSDVILHNNLQGSLKIRHLSSFILELKGNNTHGYGTYAHAGGTIRFSEAANLGSLTVESQSGGMKESGGTVGLNNGSSISFSGTGTVSLQNALFNTEGNWGIAVENSGATLNWDLSHKGIYDHFSEKNDNSLNDAKRTGDFTKTGAGALVVTNGSLITSKEDGTANNRTIRVKEGRLAFSGEGTWGDSSKIILHNGVTFDVSKRTDSTLTLSKATTLTSDKAAGVATRSTIEGNLTINALSTIEFIMASQHLALGVAPQFNIFDINGIFSLSGTSNQPGKQAIFQFSFLNGLYVNQEGFYLLLTADNDLRNLDLSHIKLAGLPETNSRQAYNLYASGAEWTNSDGVLQSAYGNGEGKELYLYASPDTATLTWDRTTGGTWELKGSDDNKLSWDAKGQAIKDGDTRFYHSDAVIFGDNVGDTAGNIKEIKIVGELLPANVTVTGEGHYSFTGDGSISGQSDLVKEGSGILDIYTSNSYTSGTLIREGTVNAYAESSLGSGLIRLEEGATLNVGRKEGNVVIGENNALGSADLTISGGTLNIYTTNSAERHTLLTGGFIYAYGSDSLGNGTLIVQGGSVYARGENAIGGNVFLSGAESHFYTEAINALGKTTVTVSNGATIHSALNPEPGWSMGVGSSIILSNGGIFELNSSTAINELEKIKFDGGEIRVNNKKIDATGFKGIVELTNAKKSIINTIGKDSQLTLSGQLGTLITAHILKKGEGELIGKLTGDFRAAMEIENGFATIVQGKDDKGNYTTHQFTGDILGKGAMAFEGGSIYVTSNMNFFDGQLYVNLDQDQDFFIQTQHDDNEELFDVTINQGNFWIDDNSGSNILHCGNLSSGNGAFAYLSTISMSKLVDPSTVRSGATISVVQDKTQEFKGIFINGGTQGTLKTTLEKEGAATLILTGDSTTTGTMNIFDGSIQLGNGGTTGHWNGNIVNNSKLVMNYGNVLKTYDKEISGTGNIDIKTAGTVAFSSQNTYTGETNINGGTVRLQDEGTLGLGDINMSGSSTLDVVNTTGVENRTIRIVSNSVATIKTAKLGDRGILTTASINGEPAAVSVTGGKLDQVTLVTTNNKATLSGIVSGSSITLDASIATQSPILSNMTLGEGSMATANSGSSSISNRLSLSYGANAIVGTAGSREIIDAKLSLGIDGSYNVSQMNQLGLNVNSEAIASLGNETKFTIHLFGKNADLSKVFAGYDTSKLGNIVLDSLLKSEGWSVSKDSTSGDSAWWKSGAVILVKNAPIPEPSSSALLLAGALLAGLRRKRHA